VAGEGGGRASSILKGRDARRLVQGC